MCDLNDVCTIVYTAADKGYAKAAMLTRKNILTNAQGIIDCEGVNEKSTCCALLPFYHLFGLQAGFLAPLLAHGSVLIEDISDLRRLKTIISNIAKFRLQTYTQFLSYTIFSVLSQRLMISLKASKVLFQEDISYQLKFFRIFLKNQKKKFMKGMD